jgi:hypothetical protein
MDAFVVSGMSFAERKEQQQTGKVSHEKVISGVGVSSRKREEIVFGIRGSVGGGQPGGREG